MTAMQSEGAALTRQHSAPATRGEYETANPRSPPLEAETIDEDGYFRVGFEPLATHSRELSREHLFSRIATLNDEEAGRSRREHEPFARGSSPIELGIEPPGRRHTYHPSYDSQGTFVEQGHTYAPRRALYDMWERFNGKGRRAIGWRESLKNIALSSGS
jgi:hypothetical protein